MCKCHLSETEIMKRNHAVFAGLLISFIIIATAYFFYSKETTVQCAKLLALYDKNANYARVSVSYPKNGTLFPPDIIAPTFLWADHSKEANAWLLHLDFKDGKPCLDAVTQNQEWQPTDEEWQTIKARSLENTVHVSIFGFNRKKSRRICSKADFQFTTSKDSVIAPIFYREVNLPFEDAVKDPTKIRWRFGCISDKQQPPVVLQKLPVCGNCHSFSREGHWIGLDVDYANDKGSYAFTPVQQNISLSEENIITWSDYKRSDKVNTFGLLSQVSPDGRYVISTVKDRSVFVAKPDLYFSQLFFPIKGILAYYDSETKEFHALRGADNHQYVQSNASWSPDGKYIVFARNEAYKLKNLSDNARVLLTAKECEEFLKGEKEFTFDLYRIPFNEGKGGMPEPLKGASLNGKSNFFAKYSPDGKWIVFCQAKSYMLLQPDSELFIIPAEGGKARRLSCNTNRMNSWHSWSPNSTWLVFSSKQNSPYTQLFLTHIDSQGVSSPPVLLKQFTNKNMAANIPEFVNAEPKAIQHIQKNFLSDLSYVRAGNEAMLSKDYPLAEIKYKKALQLDENNVDATIQLAVALAAQKKLQEAELYARQATKLDTANASAFFQLGDILCQAGRFAEGLKHLNHSVQIDVEFPTVHFVLGQANEKLGNYSEAIGHYKDFIKQYTQSFKAYYCLIELLLQQGDAKQAAFYASKAETLDKENSSFSLGNLFTKYGHLDSANKFYTNAIDAEPDNPEPICNLAANLFKQREYEKAIAWYEKALFLKGDALQALIGLSSILIMAPDLNLRDGKKVIELSQKACEITNYQSEVPLSLLSAAHAECGEFDKALEIAWRALAIAQFKQNKKMSERIAAQISMYENAKSL